MHLCVLIVDKCEKGKNTLLHSFLHVHTFIPLSVWSHNLLVYQTQGGGTWRRVKDWGKWGKRSKKERSVTSIATLDPIQNTPHISGQGQHSMGPLSELFVNWQMLLDECVKEEKTKRVGLSIRRVLAFIAASSQLCPTFVLQSIHLPDKQHVFLHCPLSLLLNCCSPFPCSVFAHPHCNFYVSKSPTSLLVATLFFYSANYTESWNSH